MSKFSGFIIAGQFLGPHTGIDADYNLLKEIVERRMTVTRAVGIQSVHLAFRVDGRFGKFNCAKAERLRLYRSKQEAGVDLGVPVESYEGKSKREIRLYLCDCVESALDLFIQRVRKKKFVTGANGFSEIGLAPKRSF